MTFLFDSSPDNRNLVLVTARDEGQEATIAVHKNELRDPTAIARKLRVAPWAEAQFSAHLWRQAVREYAG